MKTGLTHSRASSLSFGRSASRNAERRAVITTTTLSTDGELRNDARELRVAELLNALCGGVDRVLRRAVGRHVHVERARVASIEHRHIEPGGSAGVGHPDAGAAGCRADADAVSSRQAVAAGEKADREVEHFVEVAAFDQSVAVEDGAIGGRRTGQHGGMRGNGAAARLGLADLADDQRLASLERLLRGAFEFFRRLHRFDEQQEDIRAAFIEHVVEKVGDFEHGFIAGGGDVTELEIARPCAIEESKAKPAALRNYRDLTAAERLRRHERPRAFVGRRAEIRA